MKKFISTFLSISIIFSLVSAASAIDITPPDDHLSRKSNYDIFSKNLTELINIDNIYYLFEYSYQGSVRVTTITNTQSGTINIISYDPQASTFSLNGTIIESSTVGIGQSDISPCAEYQVISTETHRISWVAGTTTAIVAGAIATYLGTSTQNVIAAIGVGALGVLAAQSTGGTLYIELLLYTAPLATPQNVLKWTFTASTGDKYGPFYTYL